MKTKRVKDIVEKMDPIEYAVYRLNKLNEEEAFYRYIDYDMASLYCQRQCTLYTQIEEQCPGKVYFDEVADCWKIESSEEGFY